MQQRASECERLLPRLILGRGSRESIFFQVQRKRGFGLAEERRPEKIFQVSLDATGLFEPAGVQSEAFRVDRLDEMPAVPALLELTFKQKRDQTLDCDGASGLVGVWNPNDECIAVALAETDHLDRAPQPA